MSFLIGGKVKVRYDFLLEDSTIKMRSWRDAEDICKEMGARLPHFESKEKLRYFLALLKLSKDVPLLYSVYIGLRLNPNVSSLL